jgi:hypothetical protein
MNVHGFTTYSCLGDSNPQGDSYEEDGCVAEHLLVREADGAIPETDLG